MSYSEKVIEHYNNPRNVGALPKDDATVGTGLVGVLYILDEPSIGLHQRDNARLLGTLQNLRDMGNTVVVVEHDEETIREADWVIDLGPEGGVKGGEIVAQGTPEAVARVRRTRDEAAHRQAMDAVETAAGGGTNLVPPIIAAVKQECTVGEISDVFRGAFGVYRDPAWI